MRTRAATAIGGFRASLWRDIDKQTRCLTVREAVYKGMFNCPKIAAGHRQIPLSYAAIGLIRDWKAGVERAEPEVLVFST